MKKVARTALCGIVMVVNALVSQGCSHPFPGSDDELLLLTAWRFLDYKKFIFATSQTHDGNFATGYANGIAGADAFCQQQKDQFGQNVQGFGFEYKALLADDTNRRASTTANADDGQITWVLKANTAYYRPDGTLIFTTNAAALYPLASNLSASFTGTTEAYWTGLDQDWLFLLDCTDWSGTGTGTKGIGNSVGATALSNGSNACSSLLNRLLCVRL